MKWKALFFYPLLFIRPAVLTALAALTWISVLGLAAILAISPVRNYFLERYGILVQIAVYGFGAWLLRIKYDHLLLWLNPTDNVLILDQ